MFSNRQWRDPVCKCGCPCKPNDRRMPGQVCPGNNRQTALYVRAIPGPKPTSIEEGYPVGQGSVDWQWYWYLEFIGLLESRRVINGGYA